MSSYIGKHAQYYDIFYQGKNYAEEAAFVHECIERYRLSEGRRILELACGTGNHAFVLEALGYSVMATDYSEDLLEVAEKKARAKKSDVDFRMADMRSLALDDPPFDVVTCLFDSIGYVQSNDSVTRVLQNVHRYLLPGGLFIFEFWHAEAMLQHHDPVRVRRWPLPDAELLRISSTTLDEEKNLAEVAYEIFELRNDLTYEVTRETQVNRFFEVNEMEVFLQQNKFEALSWLNGYTWDENIDDHSWHVLAIARRA